MLDITDKYKQFVKVCQQYLTFMNHNILGVFRRILDHGGNDHYVFVTLTTLTGCCF